MAVPTADPQFGKLCKRDVLPHHRSCYYYPTDLELPFQPNFVHGSGNRVRRLEKRLSVVGRENLSSYYPHPYSPSSPHTSHAYFPPLPRQSAL